MSGIQSNAFKDYTHAAFFSQKLWLDSFARVRVGNPASRCLAQSPAHSRFLSPLRTTFDWLSSCEKWTKSRHPSVHHATWLLCMLSYLCLWKIYQYSGQLRWVSGIFGIGAPSAHWLLERTLSFSSGSVIVGAVSSCRQQHQPWKNQKSLDLSPWKVLRLTEKERSNTERKAQRWTSYRSYMISHDLAMILRWSCDWWFDVLQRWHECTPHKSWSPIRVRSSQHIWWVSRWSIQFRWKKHQEHAISEKKHVPVTNHHRTSNTTHTSHTQCPNWD